MKYTTFDTEIDVSKLNTDALTKAIECIDKDIVALNAQKKVLIEELRNR